MSENISKIHLEILDKKRQAILSKLQPILNGTRGVDNEKIRQRIIEIVKELIENEPDPSQKPSRLRDVG